MTAAEKCVLAALFDMLADSMSAAGCNDFDLLELMPRVGDRRALMRRAFEINGTPEDFNSEADYEVVMDFHILDYFADKLGLEREVTE